MGKTQVPLQFDSCWQCPELSDIQIHIIEQERDQLAGSSRPCKRHCSTKLTGDEDAKRPVKLSIPCSKAILTAGSEYFKTRFMSDMEKGATEFPLVVGVGEADAAVTVVRSMYEGLPEDATVCQLILMFKVADSLQATSTGLIVEALMQLPAEAWTWEDVLMVCF